MSVSIPSTQIVGELIESNKQALSERVTQKVLPRTTSQSGDILFKAVLAAIEAIAVYFLNEDITKYQQFFQGYTQGLFQQSTDAMVSGFQVVSEGITAEISALVEQSLPGPENERIRILYYRKIQGLHTLANVSAINAHINHRSKKAKNDE
jgi:hypothetical protein